MEGKVVGFVTQKWSWNFPLEKIASISNLALECLLLYLEACKKNPWIIYQHFLLHMIRASWKEAKSVITHFEVDYSRQLQTKFLSLNFQLKENLFQSLELRCCFFLRLLHTKSSDTESSINKLHYFQRNWIFLLLSKVIKTDLVALIGSGIGIGSVSSWFAFMWLSFDTIIWVQSVSLSVSSVKWHIMNAKQMSIN